MTRQVPPLCDRFTLSNGVIVIEFPSEILHVDREDVEQYLDLVRRKILRHAQLDKDEVKGDTP